MQKRVRRVDLLKGNGIYLEFNQTDISRGGIVVERSTKDKVKRAAHEDLIDCFKKLVPHLMFTCKFSKPEVFAPEWFDNWVFLDDPRFEGVSVTGVVIVGEDERDGVKLLGRITHKNGDVVAFNSPIVYFEDQSEHKYPLANLLDEHVDALLLEAEEYHSKGKYAPDPQQEIFENN